MIRVAMEDAAVKSDFGGQDRVADLLRKVSSFVGGGQSAHRVRKALQAGKAKHQAAAREFLTGDVLEQIGGGAESLDRCQPGIGSLRPVSSALQPFPGAGIASLLEMKCNRVGIVGRSRRQRFGDSPVPGPAPRWRDGFVEGFPSQRVNEADAGAVRLGLEQMRLHRHLDNGECRLFVEIGEASPDFERHLLTHDGGDR